LNADINCLQDALYVVTPKNVKLSTLWLCFELFCVQANWKHWFVLCSSKL
jgi:hypothetical protein